MVNTKKIKIHEVLIFCFLAIFPLGQLVRINFGEIRIQLLDLVAILTLSFILKKLIKNYFLIFPLFFGNLIWFATNGVYLTGLLYFLRILSFVSLFLLVRSLVNRKKEYKKILIKILIFESLVIACLGWLQYFFLADLRSLKFFGWDDHWYRLVGTFLDPGFIGILLCLGFILCVYFWIESKKIKYLLASFFLTITLAFTYSRASMLALIISILLIGFFKKRIFVSLVSVLIFTLSIFLLPRPASEGVELERVYSINSRFENYKETFEIFKKNPIFGVGFNNLCSARIKYFQNNTTESHSCAGSDSSILFVFSTIGIVGFLILTNYFVTFLKLLNTNNFNAQIILTSGLALLIHSQFTNSLVYPWVLGWFAILLGSLWSKIYR